MSFLTPQLIVPLVALLIWLFTAGGWYVEAQKAERYKARAEACEARHQAFADQVKAQGKLAEQSARAKEADYRRIHDETSNAWAAALGVVRADAARRLRDATRQRAGGGGMPGATAATQGTDAAPEGALPAPERIIADCAEDALSLVWLQHWIKETHE